MKLELRTVKVVLVDGTARAVVRMHDEDTVRYTGLDGGRFIDIPVHIWDAICAPELRSIYIDEDEEL